MENAYERLLREVDEETRKNTRANGTEIWQAILAASQQMPKSLQHAFIVQVLVSIFDDQHISSQALDRSLQSASSAVRRVQEYLNGRVA